ncbi:hypothetical protein KUTeg_011892 [Tegillarca granosa]|uniref:Uncharacterized protein n=1 Tax=Tegillarca granosa TaxID=220873 RepID=A0ABQ9EXY7_TEGGR|nr:hypothetical protein KUTeg_011892 [Tegillarca granosa]
MNFLSTVLLENLCIHGILLLTIPSSGKKLSGVKEALGYMIAFLQMSLERQYLPHFYYGNIYLLQMFPDSLQILESEKLDLFSDVLFKDKREREKKKRKKKKKKKKKTNKKACCVGFKKTILLIQSS